MPKIVFQPAGKTFEAPPGTSVFEAAQEADIFVDNDCGGMGSCGRCRVVVMAGAETLPPFTDEEDFHLGNVFHITRERLACQVIPEGDVEVEVPSPRPKKKFLRR